VSRSTTQRIPEALDEDTDAIGLRAVAIFEAVKGGTILLLGLGLLGLLHKDLESVTESLLIHLHVNPETRLSRALLNAAERMTDARLWGIAGGAVAYSAVRFIESWGLWNRRVWAEWFAILSGTMYLPWELEKVLEGPNTVHVALLLCNLAIVLYMALVRAMAYRRLGNHPILSFPTMSNEVGDRTTDRRGSTYVHRSYRAAMSLPRPLA